MAVDLRGLLWSCEDRRRGLPRCEQAELVGVHPCEVAERYGVGEPLRDEPAQALKEHVRIVHRSVRCGLMRAVISHCLLHRSQATMATVHMTFAEPFT